MKTLYFSSLSLISIFCLANANETQNKVFAGVQFPFDNMSKPTLYISGETGKVDEDKLTLGGAKLGYNLSDEEFVGGLYVGAGSIDAQAKVGLNTDLSFDIGVAGPFVEALYNTKSGLNVTLTSKSAYDKEKKAAKTSGITCPAGTKYYYTSPIGPGCF